MERLLSDRARIWPLLAVAVAVALGSVLVILLTSRSTGGGASPSATPASAGGASGGAKAVKLRISNYAFAPSTTTVAAGATVSWTNQDGTAHTATGSAGSFDTGTIGPGQTKSATFKKAGTYQYICSFHAFMRGTIVVK